ncbi:Hypothetical protein Cp106_0047 [Corynebacterium pseudotuberculosis 1/06-A]|nr:Hypothetical protein Cp106_0047 [Corynebacterium pseudotuberculosis 1/06-A]
MSFTGAINDGPTTPIGKYGFQHLFLAVFQFT